MLSERTIINALILTAGLMIGPYLAISAFASNYWPLYIAGGSIFLLIAFFFVENRICALPLFGLGWSGKLNFMPFQLDMGLVCAFATILYYVIACIALRQKTLKIGPRVFFYPVMIIGLITLYHFKSFGLRVIGGDTEGSRTAISVFFFVITYFCAINIANPPVVFLRRLPWYILALTAISNLPYFITTYYPKSIYLLIYLSSNVNLSAYYGEEIVRGSGLSAIGASLQVILLAYFPIYTWWRPGRWWVAGLSLACFGCVALGGYRSGMALYFLSFMMGAWCHCSWKSLILLPLCVIALLGLNFAQSNHLMPLSMQRSLAFLPGHWNQDVQDSVASSNDFRDQVQRLYRQEYLAQSPILGNGFIIDVNQVQEDLYKQGDPYYAIKYFLDTKNFHIGWISAYDAVGIVGSAAFVLLGASVIYLSGRSIFGPGRARRSPLLPTRIYIFCSVTRDMIGYFTVFGSFPGSFAGLCSYAIILAHLREMERKSGMPAARPPEHELFGLPEFGKHWPAKPVGEA